MKGCAATWPVTLDAETWTCQASSTVLCRDQTCAMSALQPGNQIYLISWTHTYRQMHCNTLLCMLDQLQVQHQQDALAVATGHVPADYVVDVGPTAVNSKLDSLAVGCYVVSSAIAEMH